MSLKKLKKIQKKSYRECNEVLYDFYTNSDNWNKPAINLMPEFNKDKLITIRIINDKLSWLSERNLFDKKTFDGKIIKKLKEAYGDGVKRMLYDIGLSLDKNVINVR